MTDAAPFHNQAIEFLNCYQLGDDHVELGRSLADLGVLYRYTGRLAESTRLIAINNLSVALRREGARREADRLVRRAQRLYIAP